MEECYVLAKKLIDSRFDKNYEYYNMILIALTTLLYKYKDYTFLVEKIFNETDIIIEKDSIRNILKKENIDVLSFEEEKDKIDEGINTTYGISSLGYTFIIDNYELVKHKDKPFIACTSKCSETTLLNSFIHEFNHLVKSSLNTLESGDLTYSIRCGIGCYKCRYDVEEGTLREEDYYDSLDEAINVMQTTEMMKTIELLQIDDPSVKKYLDSLDKEDMVKDSGYDICVETIRPLWNNPKFRNLIEDNIIEGNINNIITSFDSVLGEGTFNKFADYIDDLDLLGDFNKNKLKITILQRIIGNIINKYNNKTYYTYHK